MKWATSETLRTTRMLAVGRYVIKWIGALEGKSMCLEDARIEMWRKMILSSQIEKAGEELQSGEREYSFLMLRNTLQPT